MSTDEKRDSERTSELESAEDSSALAANGLAGGLASDELAGGESEGELVGGDDGGAGKRMIGLERWVQLGFVAAAILLVWLYDHLINAIWYLFADPNDALVTAGSVVAGLATAVVLYRNAGAYALVHGVTEELSKVSWPTRKETSSSTVVVVITSIVAALVLFLFDSVWSAVTDLVYKV